MLSFSRLLALACAVAVVNAIDAPTIGGEHVEAGTSANKRSPEAHFLERRIPAPAGYQLVFGPTGGANNAPGYMGYTALTSYDINACAVACNNRGADPVGGACKYFNIWQGVQPGKPDTFTCSMYWEPSDASTAVNTGQGTLKVTNSRGYARVSLLPDGGFEEYTCPSSGTFCFTTSDANWIGTGAGHWDALIFDNIPYAHTGHSSGLLGSGDGADADPGTLTAAHALHTTHGAKYQISFFQQSTFSGAASEAASFIDVKWNGVTVLSITPGFQDWTFYEVEVTGTGNDHLAFFGGKAPAWSFIDDVYVFAM